jgi:hypothetical protein
VIVQFQCGTPAVTPITFSVTEDTTTCTFTIVIPGNYGCPQGGPGPNPGPGGKGGSSGLSGGWIFCIM